jgi:hypothetical protein
VLVLLRRRTRGAPNGCGCATQLTEPEQSPSSILHRVAEATIRAFMRRFVDSLADTVAGE